MRRAAAIAGAETFPGQVQVGVCQAGLRPDVFQENWDGTIPHILDGGNGFQGVDVPARRAIVQVVHHATAQTTRPESAANVKIPAGLDGELSERASADRSCG